MVRPMAEADDALREEARKRHEIVADARELRTVHNLLCHAHERLDKGILNHGDIDLMIGHLRRADFSSIGIDLKENGNHVGADLKKHLDACAALVQRLGGTVTLGPGEIDTAAKYMTSIEVHDDGRLTFRTRM